MSLRDLLTRYIFSRSHFSRDKGIAKTGAFLPQVVEGEAVLSVFHITGLDEAAAWQIGEVVSIQSSRTLYARGDILGEAIHMLGLQVAFDNVPPRHASVVGWPSNEEDRIALAAELAQSATLVVKD